jgi:hypothetical protein
VPKFEANEEKRNVKLIKLFDVQTIKHSVCIQSKSSPTVKFDMLYYSGGSTTLVIMTFVLRLNFFAFFHF